MNSPKKNTNTKSKGRPPLAPGRHLPKRKMESSLDPQLLVNRAKEMPVVEATPAPSKRFDELTLDKKLQQNIQAKGYEFLTPIQEKAIPVLLDGKDMVAISRTGSGKTAAFLIPLIMRLMQRPLAFSILIVTPTRELALQIGDEFQALTQGMNFRWGAFIGGLNINTDLKNLKQKPQVVVGTPGRLLDLAKQKALPLREVSTLVLDEFDRMLDMGFVHDVKRLAEMIGSREQTLLFSATQDPSQKKLVASLLNQPVEIQINPGTSSHEHIEQETIRVPEDGDKFVLLQSILDNQEYDKVILFAETKRLADRLSKKLNQVGVSAGQIHGDKSQNFRNKVLSDFKSGNLRVLVATDVAARGIDVADVSLVINYQVPMTMDAYTHRIGRTGRAGKTGRAITFI